MPQQLRERTGAAELPDVMVPARVMALPAALPLTPNGKVDRRALPAPLREPGDAPSAAPHRRANWKPPSRRSGRKCWACRVSTADENFFDLGGHSLLVVQVQRRLRDAFGQEVSITDMFRLTTDSGARRSPGRQCGAQRRR